jgi:hypothetical protein
MLGTVPATAMSKCREHGSVRGGIPPWFTGDGHASLQGNTINSESNHMVIVLLLQSLQSFSGSSWHVEAQA